MPIDATEVDFERDVLERSKEVPVVVDFWADWCGPCKQLSPALEAAETKRDGEVVLAKVDVDSNQALAARFGVQGIPAVKAFRDGEIVDEFVGAVPPAQVEAFFDGLAPSRADELLAAGDELSLREASELEPRRADIAVALAKARLARGAEAEALEAVEHFPDDFAAAGHRRPREARRRPASPPRPGPPSTTATAPPPSTPCSRPCPRTATGQERRRCGADGAGSGFDPERAPRPDPQGDHRHPRGPRPRRPHRPRLPPQTLRRPLASSPASPPSGVRTYPVTVRAKCELT